MRASHRSASRAPTVLLPLGKLPQAICHRARPVVVAHLQQRLDEIRRKRELARLVDSLPLHVLPDWAQALDRVRRFVCGELGARAHSYRCEKMPGLVGRFGVGDCRRRPPLRLVGNAESHGDLGAKPLYDPDPISSPSGDSSHSSRSRDAVPHSPARSSSSHRWRRSTTTDTARRAPRRAAASR